MIDAANAARKKPGISPSRTRCDRQLLLESSYGCTPERVVDGVTTNMLWQDGTRNQLPDWISPSPGRRRRGSGAW